MTRLAFFVLAFALLVAPSLECEQIIDNCCLFASTGNILCVWQPNLAFPPPGFSGVISGERFKRVDFGDRCDLEWAAPAMFSYLPHLAEFYWNVGACHNCLFAPNGTKETIHFHEMRMCNKSIPAPTIAPPTKGTKLGIGLGVGLGVPFSLGLLGLAGYFALKFYRKYHGGIPAERLE